MATEIQFKSFTTSEWTTNQGLLGNVPILINGEVGYESDTGKFKIGDGTNIWSALSYFQSGAGSSGNSFETISVPSGTSPVADSSTDTLTLSAGTGITITGNSSTDTITIASTITDTNTTYDLTSTGTSTASINLVPSSGATDSVTITGSGATSISHSTGAITVSSTDTDTTYTLASGTNNGTLKLTPSSGSVQDNIAVTGLGTAAFSATTAYISSTLMTTLGDTIYGGASGASTRLAGPTTNGTYVLTSVPSASVSVAPSWALASGLTVSSATTATKSTNLVGGNSTTLLGSIPYQSNTDTTTLLGPNTTTTRNFLRQIGNGTNGAAPTWDTLVDGDIPTALTGKSYNGLTLTSTTGTFTLTSAKTFAVQNTMTLSSSADGNNLNIGSGGTLGTGAFATIANYAALSGATFTGNIAINNGTSTAITTTGTTAAIFNTGATTLNVGGAGTTISLGATTGTTTINNGLVLAAGTSSKAPLTLTSGTSLTSATAGSVEYDGITTYATPNNGGRAVDMLGHYYTVGSGITIDSATTTASILDAATLGITVAAGTTYELELVATAQHTFGTSTTATTSAGFTITTVTGAPNATFTYQFRYGSNLTGNTTATADNVVLKNNTGSHVQLVGSAITTGSRWIFFMAKGLVRVTGTGTVKIYPSITQSVTGNTVAIQQNSYFKLTPIGNTTNPLIVGNWS
jgi:hypothetical protein